MAFPVGKRGFDKEDWKELISTLKKNKGLYHFTANDNAHDVKARFIKYYSDSISICLPSVKKVEEWEIYLFDDGTWELK